MVSGKELSENVFLTLTARLAMVAMPGLLLVLGWFMSDLIATQRATLGQFSTRADMIESKLGGLDLRVTSIEVDRKREQEVTLTSKSEILRRLDVVSDGQTETVKGLSALNATVSALKEQVDLQFSRPHL